MDEENRGINFILGFTMGVGSGLFVGIVLFAGLVYFAPEFLGCAIPINPQERREADEEGLLFAKGLGLTRSCAHPQKGSTGRSNM